jgi:serine protease Do
MKSKLHQTKIRDRNSMKILNEKKMSGPFLNFEKCTFKIVLPVILFLSFCNLSICKEVPYTRQTPVVQAVKKVSAAVVNISSEYEVRDRVNPFFHFSNDPFFRDFFDRGYERKRKLTSLGSGVIIDGTRGLILTNEHVVVKTGTITVVLNDGHEFKADIVGSDPQTDLAVLRLDTAEPLPSIEMGDSSDIMIGETVIAIGNPFGFSNTVTTGVVSAVNRSFRTDDREFHDFIQTDASINPGNSGGPLLNINGELIGINTAIYAKAEGIGFAIPINKARKIISDLVTYGEVVHAWIGITAQNIDQHLALYLDLPMGSGVVVTHIEPDSPAADAGMQEGDILISSGGNRINSIADYELMMRSAAKGDVIPLRILRKGKHIDLTARASVFPEELALELAFRLMGVKVIDIVKNNRVEYRGGGQSGVIIDEIDKHSALARINVRPGDVIRQMDEIAINNIEDFKKAIIKYRWKESVVILLQRGGEGYYITVQL